MSQLALQLIRQAKAEGWKELDLGNTGLTELPDELFDVEELETLIISNKCFDFENFESLLIDSMASENEEVEFFIQSRNKGSENCLSGKLPSGIARLKKLKQLYIGDDEPNWALSDITAIENLPQLNTLYLHSNQISDISPLKKLTNLRILFLSSDQIKDISVLEKLTNLNILLLNENQISDISALEKLTNLNILLLSENQISDISALEKLTNLNSLYLLSNEISDISPLEKLTNLNILLLSENQISDISALEKLTNLTTLDLRSNNISDIGVLEQLTNLTTLYLSDNNISDIGILEQLTNLTTLDLSSNKQIKDFSVLEQLTNLTTLYLSYNKQIKDFSVLEQLTNLTTLYLSDNNIKDLTILQRLPNLQEVYASGNRIIRVPKALIEENNCLPHLRAWWAETADPTNTQPNRTVKLMLTGNSNTGKSSLVNALQVGKCEEDKKSTDGIQLEQWNYTMEAPPVQFCIWDFGGQEIFHGTHRLFLAAEAIQLILFDPETERNAEENKPTPNRLRMDENNRNLPLRYWVETIQELSSDSIIMVVQNKIDQYLEKYMPARQLLAKFETIEELKCVSAWTGKGIKSLQFALQENARELHEYEMPMPKSWLAVQQYFLDNLNQEEPERLLSYIEFERRCREQYGVLEIAIPSLLTLLHHNGVVYYNEQYLKDTIIADQRWALDAIYKPLHHDSDFYDDMRKDYKGKVRIKHIFNAFGANYKKEEKLLFLNLMRSCALCFPLKEKENQQDDDEDTRYIFPEFLQIDVPESVQVKLALKQTNLQYYRRQYEYLNTYRIQTLIANLGQKTLLKYIWRNGILIETAEGIFVVEADYNNNVILIRMEEGAINQWLYEIIQALEKQNKLEEVAPFWSVSQDQENYSAVDLAGIRNRNKHSAEQSELEEEKSIVEKLPDVIQVNEETNASLTTLEKDGLQKYLTALIEKINTYRQDFVIASDTEKRFTLKTQIQELEVEIETTKQKLKNS